MAKKQSVIRVEDSGMETMAAIGYFAKWVGYQTVARNHNPFNLNGNSIRVHWE